MNLPHVFRPDLEAPSASGDARGGQGPHGNGRGALASVPARHLAVDIASDIRVVSPARFPRRTKREYGILYALSAATDVASVVVGILAAAALHLEFPPSLGRLLLLLAISPVVTASIFTAFRLYSAHVLAPAEEFRRVIFATTIAIAAVFTIWMPSRPLFSAPALVALGVAITLTLGSRRAWHHYIWRARGRGRFVFRTLIVGTNREAERLAEVMESDRTGFQPIGFVAPNGASVPTGAEAATAPTWAGSDAALSVVGESGDLRRIIRDTGAECVFVASSTIDVAEMQELSKAARLEGVELRVTSCLPEVLSTRCAVQPLGGVMAISLRPTTLTPVQAAAKRAFDLAVSSIAVVLSLPLWSCIALIVKVTSPGPILYR